MVHNQLGMVRFRQQKFKHALIQYHESLKMDPQQPGLLNSSAHLFLTCPDKSLQDPYKAVKLAYQACQLTQWENPMFLNTLYVAYVKLEHYSEALNTCQRALKLLQAAGDHERADRMQKEIDWIKKALQKQNNTMR